LSGQRVSRCVVFCICCNQLAESLVFNNMRCRLLILPKFLAFRFTYHGEGREGVVFSSRLGASPRTGRVVKWEEILASNSGKRRKPLDMMGLIQ
jgi:hypothetical protein